MTQQRHYVGVIAATKCYFQSLKEDQNRTKTTDKGNENFKEKMITIAHSVKVTH